MSKKEKADIKISLWNNEREILKKDINNAKEQMFMWKGVGKGYKEALDALDNRLRLIRIAMNWATLKDKEKKYYEELAKKWPHMNKAGKIKEYKRVIEDWDKLDDITKVKKLERCPIQKPDAELTENEGFNLIRFLQPMQSTFHACIRLATEEPGKFQAQIDMLQRQIQRLEAMIKNERSKKEEDDSPLGEDDKNIPLGDDPDEPL